MTVPRDIAMPMQRVTWRDGQRLLARDLDDQSAQAERLRRLHIRYLHRTWGIVTGVDLQAIGAGAVQVGVGYALDRDGGLLLRPLPERFAAPAIVPATTMYLVLAHAAQGPCCPSGPDVSTLCLGKAGAAPLFAAILSWKTLNEVRPGVDILLARVLVTGGSLASALDRSVQRRATSMARPHLLADATQPGLTGWTDVSGRDPAEIEAVIDTSGAGCIRTPGYFARLAGAPPAATAFIVAADPAHFTLMVRVGNVHAAIGQSYAAQAEQDGWTVSWTAVDLSIGHLP